MRHILLAFFALALLSTCSPKLDNISSNAKNDNPKNLANQNSSALSGNGFMDFSWDDKSGKLLLSIENFDEEFLYVNSLAAGIGSNDIGLDRGQLGGEHVVKFEKIGPKVFLKQVNYDYRAESDNEMEQRSVEEAFAQSVLWGFKVESETNEKVTVDATPFLLRDAHDVVGRLKRSKQGTYKVDLSRSAVYLPRCKAFPKNTELEATITFVGEPKGNYIRSVTPSPQAVTVRQHHSFIELPDDNYTPRIFDPRCGYFDISYQDYATPIDESLTKRYITRHRLEKKNPEAEKSEAVEPIIYYLDPGAPEPVKSALLDGTRWWNQAFEAAGYVDAFQVQILPEDADPMDVRYNVIQWVHRATRGWSYGASVIDPRTGEIIKGHVSLGSLRVRQDFLIAQGLLGPYKVDSAISNEMQEMALARLRQLSAHEVGHTIGLAHNFAASYNDRASVMDYPHPYITMDENEALDFSNAYDDKIGVWDKRTVLYGYQDIPSTKNEGEVLKDILAENNRLGLKYISDEGARPLGGAHPYAHLWDNGSDPVKEFKRISKLRKVALDKFSTNHIPIGSPHANLEEVLVPVYLAHRFQMEAVAKWIGGVDYAYTSKNDGESSPKVVDDEMQKQALQTLVNSMSADFLMLPSNVIDIIPPKPIGYKRTRESFKSKTGLTLDPISIAESSIAATLKAILHPHRANRLVQHKALGKSEFGFSDLLETLFEDAFKASGVGYKESLNRARDFLMLEELLSLTKDSEASAETKGICLIAIANIQKDLSSLKNSSATQESSISLAIDVLESFKNNPDKWQRTQSVVMPAGSPIGCGEYCTH